MFFLENFKSINYWFYFIIIKIKIYFYYQLVMCDYVENVFGGGECID